MIRLFAFCFSILLLISCTSKKDILNPQQSLSVQLNSAINQQHHIGFILKELGSDKVLFEQNGAKSFTAASNMKLLNFYVGLNMLGDSLPSFQYLIKGDSLLIWPMADPTFLHPSFKEQKAFDFLKNSGKSIYIISGRYKGEKFGRGWSWDDYNESFQTEITDFPLYGNVVSCVKDTVGGLKFSPDLASLYFSELSTSTTSTVIKRNLYGNNLSVPANLKTGYQQSLPISFNKNILESLLTDTLLATGLITSSVQTLSWRPVPPQARVIYSAKTADVYAKMLQDSDNFIAEELLLNYAAANKMEMNGKTLIKYAAKYFPDLPSSYQWVDGSGLSRLNLVSPEMMIDVLEKIKTKVNDEQQLFSLFAAGGKSGTLKNMFTANPETFIYAKSGSLSNNYNLSGYLIGKSGKRYAFSYLNNNFQKPAKEVKAEVERFLTFVHDHH
jgi:D-alanyl-D-alanine carboxypeptidase/D-alanyl-D-alanine-endopeptidase (penicillin-binding protein 4)